MIPDCPPDSSVSVQHHLSIAIAYSAYRPPGQDGIGRLVDAYAHALAQRGHQVHIIARSDTTEKVSILEHSKVHWITYDLSRYTAFAHLPNVYHILNYSHAVHQKVGHLIRSEGVSLLITPLWLVEGLVTAVSGLLPVVAVVETSSEKLSLIHQKRSVNEETVGRMEKLLLERADGILCISNAARQMLAELYGIDDARTQVIYPAIPVAVAAEITLLSAVPDHNKNPVVLFVGRLEKRKGIQDLMAAIPKVLDRFPSVEFVIVGRDNSRYDGFYAATGTTYPEFFTKHYPRYLDRVRFLGHVEESELQRLYRECDVFVAPSLFESFGLVFLEAMSRGKPVISCLAGAIPEVVENGVTGILVEPANSEALACAILDLLFDDAKRKRMGEAGLQRVIQRFDLSRMGQALEAHLAAVAHKKS